MPRYRFEILGPEGRKRRGKLDAPDKESAAELLRARGLEVLSLKPVLELVGNDDHQASEQERSQYRASWKDTLIYFEPDEERRRQLVLLLVVLGLMVYLGKVRKEAVVLEPLHAPQRERVVVEISGRVTPVEQTRLKFHFPEIPLDIDQPAEDIADANGEFVFHTEFTTSQMPTLCTVSASKKGHRELRLRPVTLSLDENVLRAQLTPLQLKRL